LAWSQVGNDRNIDPDARVGSRRRQSSWRQREAAQAEGGSRGDGYSVPPELALVPVSAYRGEQQ
jgi:hypothetical protein